MKLKIHLALIALFIQQLSFAQHKQFCGTDEAEKMMFEAHPELQQKYLQEEKEYIELDKKEAKNAYAAAKMQNVVYIIPVVFHIIHENGIENISNAKVHEAIDVMNRDYRKLNADTSATIAVYQSIAADCEIEFRLATLDPNGNCTSGIERYYSWQTNFGGESAKLVQWPQTKYLNIWVVKNMSPAHLNAAAYSYAPGNAPTGGDGIICLYNYVGTNSGNTHTLSHEAGHWMNLRHPWGSTNQPNVACGDDLVSDTPLTRGSNLVCNLSLQFCNSPTIENVQNFMDYSFCTTMFTLGQKTRMRAALNSGTAGRSNLWKATNLTITGTDAAPQLCAADFISNNLQSVICEDGLVKYSDVSYNGAITSRNWTFPGGVLNPPSLATDSVITVKYSTAGIYDVSLSATNAATTVSTTKQQFITVLPLLAAYNATFYSESFETSLLPSVDWEVKSPDNGPYTWQQFTGTGASGTACAYIENSNSLVDSADVDELISPTINMQAIGTNYLHYKYAFRQKTASDPDALKILVSSDCGKTWSPRKTINGAALVTATPPSSLSFTPTANQWKSDSVSIASVANKPNVRIKFQFISGEGNNIYLDDINLVGSLGISPLQNNGINLSLFPNPANGSSILSFYLNTKQTVSVSLSNLLGKQVAEFSTSEVFDAGNHRFEINKNNSLPAGIYFVKTTINGQSVVKKLVIN